MAENTPAATSAPATTTVIGCTAMHLKNEMS
jgi:hypothetical protein